jgi:hypothetical protein
MHQGPCSGRQPSRDFPSATPEPAPQPAEHPSHRTTPTTGAAIGVGSPEISTRFDSRESVRRPPSRVDYITNPYTLDASVKILALLVAFAGPSRLGVPRCSHLQSICLSRARNTRWVFSRRSHSATPTSQATTTTRPQLADLIILNPRVREHGDHPLRRGAPVPVDRAAVLAVRGDEGAFRHACASTRRPTAATTSRRRKSARPR